MANPRARAKSAKHGQVPPVPPAGPPLGGAPSVDRPTTLLEHADDVNQVLQLREQTADGRWMYLEQFDIPEVRPLGLEEFIRQSYGGGKFRAQLRERSSGIYGQSVVVVVAGARKPDHERQAQRNAASPAAAAAPATSSPAWLDKIVIPIATTLGTAIAAGIGKRLLEKAEPDPVMMKLLDRSLERPTRTERPPAVDAIELQRLLLDAERRGEDRGKEIGELKARADGEAGGSGVGNAVRDAMPLFTRLADIAERRATAAPSPELAPVPNVPSPAAPDIVPLWLRPFMRWTTMLVSLADAGKDAELYADLVLDQAPAETLAELVTADRTGTLEADLFAAIPELKQTPKREQFARELLEAIREGLTDMQGDGSDDTTDARSSGNG